MRGLAKGEQSTALNPVIQVFTRLGELLQDPVEATYQTYDIHDTSKDPVEKVASTPLDLALITDPSPGNKLGTGRFYLSVGDTTNYAYGTHRVVFKYKMVTGGREYQQLVDFEVLDAGDYPSGQPFITYASTRDMVKLGFTPATTDPRAMHLHLHQASLNIEAFTERFFEPRYMQYYVDGGGTPVLYIDEAIIALDTAYSTSREAGGAETVEALDNSLFRVYNRAVDGILNPDDRANPSLSMLATSRIPGVTGPYGRSVWPQGSQNVRVDAVFGYTDPEPGNDRILIGSTPFDMRQIIGVLASRAICDPRLKDKAAQQPGLVKKYQTRDQMIEFYGASGNVSYTGGLTGDSLLDQKLLRFTKPARLRYTDRTEFGTGRSAG
jgi:hypothetical protein